jgi:hypothetical protein
MRAEGLHDPLPQFHRGDGRAGPERASRGYCCREEQQRLIPGPCSCRGPISRYGAITCSCFTSGTALRWAKSRRSGGQERPPPVNHCSPRTTELYDRHNDGTSLDEYEQIGI